MDEARVIRQFTYWPDLVSRPCVNAETLALSTRIAGTDITRLRLARVRRLR